MQPIAFLIMMLLGFTLASPIFTTSDNSTAKDVDRPLADEVNDPKAKEEKPKAEKGKLGKLLGNIIDI
ncbi:hypothetical protein N7457_000958 [Penicillium paradoxum]|uniref:uncharacterized protein n=1 Tax=Penicillium paradoxum TaxID=176176 RepID=UPI002549BD51|nr:uncharacterized protein N7457_000958 [Penicillium paradoxum]KAJ5794359.1 hypothetical protein N7457_000958 [Penicillium paradoxum]